MSQASPKEPEEASKATEAPSEAASSPDLFFVGMALFLTAIVFIGFWPTYFRSVFLGQEPVEFGIVETAWPIHLHAAVFVVWMALFLAQTTLAARGKTRTHMRLGRYGAAFGLAVILVGVFITLVQIQTGVSQHGGSWAVDPLRARGSWTSIGLFAALLGLGYAYRTRPAAHKRYMLLATMGLVRAANARIRNVWMDEWGEILFAVTIGPYWLLLWAYDLYTERRVHPATLVGTGVVVVGEGLFFLVGMLLDVL